MYFTSFACQILSSPELNVITSPLFTPFAFNCNCILFGRFPSWLSLSSHIFSTDTEVFPGVYVLVIVVLFASSVTFFVYSLGTLTSSAVYTIFSPFLYTGKLFHVYFQLLFAFNSTTLPTLFSPAFNCTCILVGRFPSWFSLSFHTFSTLYVVSSIVCVFVIIVFPVVVVSYDTVYPSGTCSSTVYVISFSFSYFGKLLHVYFQPFSVFKATRSPLLFPFAFNCILISSGRFPSWFSLSLHTFSTLYIVSSGVCVFVIIVFPSVSVLYDAVYPSGTTSSTVYFISFPFSYFGRFVHVYFQSFAEFNVFASSILAVPVFNCTCILPGRFPSWLLLSFHFFSTLYSTFSTSCVFVIIVFPESSVLYDTVYPIIFDDSSTV